MKQRAANKADTGRVLVQRLAAHIAHLLNEGDAVVVLSPLGLRRTLIGTLAGQGYLTKVVGEPLMVLASGPEAAAERYIASVLMRRLQLARNLPMHKGHELFLLMCRRGAAGGWEGATLLRLITPAAGSPAATTPPDFTAVAGRLASIDKAVTAGNPARATRERLGPLVLLAGGTPAEVAEELSLWQAVTAGPLRLKPLAKGPAFDQLCSLMIQTLETANAHWAALVSLGVWPPDWLDEISVNTAKKAAAFMSAVRAESGAVDLDVWRTAWIERQVPGFPSAEEFWHSAFGRALREPRTAPAAIEPEALRDPDDPVERLLDTMELPQRLALALDRGVIDEFEHWLILEIAIRGETIAELEIAPRVVARRVEGPLDLGQVAADVTTRLYAFADAEEP